jgi:excisionase family DNA binding protein
MGLDLLSVDDAAKQLGGISSWTVRAWLSQGRLARVKVGRRTMIRLTELERFVRDGGNSPASKRSA